MEKRNTKIIFSLKLCLLTLLLTSCCPPFCPRDCDGVNEPCSENADCCHNHCEGGRCCRGIGADLASADPASDCCSGQIRTGYYGPYCCGTAGMIVTSADRCCEGLEWNSSTGECLTPSCPPGCTLRVGSATVGDDYCECPPGSGTTPEIAPCSPCTDPSEPNCWFYRVYHEGYNSSGGALGTECRLAGPFHASSEDEAEDCARIIAANRGLPSNRAWVVDDISDSPGRECIVP